ncbi:putative FCP1 y domain-containing protein [Glycine soja]
MDVVNDLHMGPPATTNMGGSTSTEDVNSSQKQKMARKKKQAVECEGVDFSLDKSLPKTDATIKHPLHGSPALPNFLSCQIFVEYSTNNEKSKRQKTTHNAIEDNVNGCGTPEYIFSPKASTPALDMPSEHPIQCFSSDPITSQSCVEVGICQGHNEENEQNMINTTAENSNSQHGIPEESCNHISVAASPEPFVKECVSEVVKLNTEHGINDNIPNPEDKNGLLMNTSLVKKNVDDSPDYGLSDKNLCVITYARRKIVNSSCRRNSGSPSPENGNKEPTIQDHQKDDSHESSDGPLRVCLMDGETKLSIDQVTSQSGAAAEEIKLSADNINEQRFMTTSSAVDIPSEHLETDGRQLDHTGITRNDLYCADEEIELNTDNIKEQRFMTTSSAVDIPFEQLETNCRKLDNTEITRNDLCCAGDVSDLSLDTVRDGHLKISQFSLDRNFADKQKNKLLILDLNGLLADFVSISDTPFRIYRREPEPDFVLRGKKVYKRPYCDDFLQFCFDTFHVGVWSSRSKSNVNEAIKFLMGKSASKLLFCWNQSHCTETKFTTVENIEKPLVLKEITKLWEKEEPDLPWEKGEFNESNTLLLDDSPYKALMNPRHSAIFPYSYRYYHTRDSELGPGGDLRVYLKGLAKAENVQNYVSENPFGQRPIREANPSWVYYRRVIESLKRSQNAGSSLPL